MLPYPFAAAQGFNLLPYRQSGHLVVLDAPLVPLDEQPRLLDEQPRPTSNATGAAVGVDAIPGFCNHPAEQHLPHEHLCPGARPGVKP